MDLSNNEGLTVKRHNERAKAVTSAHGGDAVVSVHWKAGEIEKVEFKITVPGDNPPSIGGGRVTAQSEGKLALAAHEEPKGGNK